MNHFQRTRAWLERLTAVGLYRWRPLAAKRLGELAYWRDRRAKEGELSAEHYAGLFTQAFDLQADRFRGTRILDLGCGPRGSLEWANQAELRIGLDPLASKYRALGTPNHEMHYVAASGEAIPLVSCSLDFVASFNALDHVDELSDTVSEIIRVLKRGGILLLMVDVNHEPTILEPLRLDWDFPRQLEPLQPLRLRHYERSPFGMAASIELAIAFDHEDSRPRAGVLVGSFLRT